MILERKKIIDQSNLSKTEANILKNGSRQRSNRFYQEDFIRNSIWQHLQQQHQKLIKQQQQNIKQFTSGVTKYTQEKICVEVSF